VGDTVASTAHRNLTNISVGTDTITTVHNFANCEEYNASVLSITMEVNMFTDAVTRTHTFALV
jgi:hypothetical protein